MVRSIVLGVSACFTILALSCGCNTVESNEHNYTKEAAASKEMFEILFLSAAYSEAKGKLPDSIDELMLFCSDSKMSCPEIDSNNFSWRKINDGQAELENKELNLTIPISVSRDIPNDIMEKHLQGTLDKEIEALFDKEKELN